MARGTYYWFNTASGGTPIGSGPQLSIPAVQSTQTVWVLDSITNGGCASARTSGSILVLEKPALVLGSQPVTCPGSSLCLQSLFMNDRQQTTGSIRVHSALQWFRYARHMMRYASDCVVPAVDYNFGLCDYLQRVK